MRRSVLIQPQRQTSTAGFTGCRSVLPAIPIGTHRAGIERSRKWESGNRPFSARIGHRWPRQSIPL